MTHQKHHQQRGFTTVEVLVTLFLGVVLLGGGYQLYGIVSNNSREARERAVASSLAYEFLRQMESNAKNPCVPSGVMVISAPTIDAAPLPGDIKANYMLTCPYGSTSLSKLELRIRYGSPVEEVSHAIFVVSQ